MINKINKKAKGFTHYVTMDGIYSPQQTHNAAPTLPPGIYTLSADQAGNVLFHPKSSMTDQLVDLPESVSEQVLAEIRKFWSGQTKAAFDRFGLVYKRGIIMYGVPGAGKTCTIAKVMDQTVSRGGIVILDPNPQLASIAVERIREIQPDIKVVMIFEEFERICDSSEFVGLLDGEYQLENVLYIATTNHIDRVPHKIKNRTRRFATVIEVGLPSAAARRAYLRAKVSELQGEELERWVKVSEGMVIDQITDLIITVFCFNESLQKAVAKIHGMGMYKDAASEEDDADDDYYDEDAEYKQEAVNYLKSLPPSTLGKLREEMNEILDQGIINTFYSRQEEPKAKAASVTLQEAALQGLETAINAKLDGESESSK